VGQIIDKLVRGSMGLAGAGLVHGAFTWQHVADLIETQLRELDDGRSPVRHRSTFSTRKQSDKAG
jgi:hypothetical protein